MSFLLKLGFFVLVPVKDKHLLHLWFNLFKLVESEMSFCTREIAVQSVLQRVPTGQELSII
jgi:hypothetical protein